MELNYQILKSLITKIMVLSVILSTWVTGSNLLYSQNKGWILPSIKYVVGQNPALSPLPTSSSGYSNQPASTASNMQLDAQNNILFFIVNGNVYNKDGIFIGTLYNYTMGVSATGDAEMVIVPDLGNCQRYYLFAAGKLDAYQFSPFYSVLDMSLPNPYDSSIMGKLVEDFDGNTAQYIPSLVTDGSYAFQAEPKCESVALTKII